MTKNFRSALALGVGLALASGGVLAQTSTAATPAASSPAATVGVTPQDAKEAAKKAVPRADTGTLVRTKPSAAQRAKELADEAKAKTSGAATTAASSASGASASASSGTTAPAMAGSASAAGSSNAVDPAVGTTRRVRPARADRN